VRIHSLIGNLPLSWYRVRSLSIVLDDSKVLLPHRELDPEQTKRLETVAEACCEVLEALNKVLDHYQELGSEQKIKDIDSLRYNIRRGWKRLKWEPEDVRDLRSRITSTISLLNAFNSILTLYDLYYLLKFRLLD